LAQHLPFKRNLDLDPKNGFITFNDKL
jgi:hypothetical protein